MKNRSIVLAVILLCVLCTGLMYHSQAGNPIDKKLIIVTTTSILADTIKNIVGNTASVISLMGPGIDPHMYRARESDVHTLANADIIFYNGLHLEGKMGQVLEGMNRFVPTYAVADALDISLLHNADFDGLYDPHIWFDVSLWIVVAHYIEQKLCENDSINADVYRCNGASYRNVLSQLHTYVQNRMNSIPHEHRILVTAHDAFSYFGKVYDCQVVALQGLSTDSDISTTDVQKLAAYIAQKKIKTIFVETSIPERSLRAVQNAVAAYGWHVNIGDELYSDALGDQKSPANNYYNMIRYNVDVIVNALYHNKK